MLLLNFKIKKRELVNMQQQNDLAINLMNLFEPQHYKEFQEGFFINKPKMRGYYYIFHKMNKPKFCLILNENPDFTYPSNTVTIQDYVYIIFSIKSMEDYIENLAEFYFPVILNVIDENLEKKNERNLPYGYYLDENGELKIDLKKASEVRKIYDLYIDLGSVREIASQLKTNFSHIREVLHSNEEYMQMQQKIVPLVKLKEVQELMAGNVKGGAVAKETTEDKIKEVRAKRKQMNKQLEMQK